MSQYHLHLARLCVTRGLHQHLIAICLQLTHRASSCIDAACKQTSVKFIAINSLAAPRFALKE
jgi:hypothetical protein